WSRSAWDGATGSSDLRTSSPHAPGRPDNVQLFCDVRKIRVELDRERTVRRDHGAGTRVTGRPVRPLPAEPAPSHGAAPRPRTARGDRAARPSRVEDRK